MSESVPDPQSPHPVMPVLTALIDAGARLRPLRPARVETLKQDIDMQGLLQPIVVVRRGQRFGLVAGLQRLAAVRALRWVEIPALVLPEDTPEAELRFAAIMENVDREDLTKLERAEHLAALKSAWEAMNPSAKNGGDRRSARVRLVKEAENARENQSAVFALCSDIAEKVGLSRRSFFIAIEIANGISNEIRDRIRDSWLGDHQAGLQVLARLDPETQAKVCDLLLSDPPGATSVADAVLLAQGRLLPRPDDKFYLRLQSNWARMAKKTRDAWIEEHKREIMDVARAKGWTF
jgi:ParB family chromosome partitioning protein